jgi:hypothetical protein
MELWEYLVVLCAVAFLFCTVSASGVSFTDIITGGSPDTGSPIPQLPSPADGSVLGRKLLDSQPWVFKSSDRLLHEAEISRDLANREFGECMVKTTEDLNNLEDTRQHGLHYTVDQTKDLWLHSPDPGFYTGEARELCGEALANYDQANKQYRAALAAAGDDYTRQARIFDSAAVMYSMVGNTNAQEQVEDAALAARARAAAESLPLPAWVIVSGVLGGLFLFQRKRK